jgi:ribosomal protein L22
MSKRDQELVKEEWEIHSAIREISTLKGTLALVHNKIKAKDYETALEYLEIASVRTETTLIALEKTLNNHELNHEPARRKRSSSTVNSR